MTHSNSTATSFIDVDGVSLFYRDAGKRDGPVLLLLHGFPSSSFQYRKLLDSSLAKKFRLIAPDLPGFGFTSVPDERKYDYTFANLTKTVAAFVDALDVDNFALYIFDYGAPVGLRLALERPDAITAIVSQNGNAFEDGLGDFWDMIRPLWENNSIENKVKLEPLLGFDATKGQYTGGESNPNSIAPESYYLDSALLARAGQFDIQMSLFYDYRTNVDLYPAFQDYLKVNQPPLLAVWGKNDTIFVPAGAEAFKRVLPDAQVDFVDGGHFAIENHADEIVGLIEEFFEKKGI